MTSLFDMPKPIKEPDSRHKAIIYFAFETYREKTGRTLLIDGRGVKAISEMLKATRDLEEYSIENLQRYWLTFLAKADAFDKKHPPLYWFATRIQRWSAESSTGTGTDAAREWMKRKLQK